LGKPAKRAGDNVTYEVVGGRASVPGSNNEKRECHEPCDLIGASFVVEKWCEGIVIR